MMNGHNTVEHFDEEIINHGNQVDFEGALPIWADLRSAEIQEPHSSHIIDSATADEDDGNADSFFRKEAVRCSPDNGLGWAFLRHEFQLPTTPVKSATLFATATSTRPGRQFVYRLWLNGEFIGIGPIFPENDESRVDAFDVTSILHEGEANAIGALAWTMEGRQFWARLDVTFSDGQQLRIGTGDHWKAIVGNRTYPSAGSVGTQYYEAPQENLQTQWYPYGFSKAGFDDRLWPHAVPQASFNHMELSSVAHVRECEHAPVKKWWLDDGSVVFDCGRSWIGGIRLQCSAISMEDAADVCVRFGEVLCDDGTVHYALSTGNTYEETWHIVPRAPWAETWGIRVFRYVQLIPSQKTDAHTLRLLAEHLSIVALEYPMDNKASFFSSNAALNSVWQFCSNTIEALNGPIYVDSWTRERAPYEADAWLQQRSHLALDMSKAALQLGRYSVDWLISNRTWPMEWPLTVILAVHDAWMASGDAGQIKAQYGKLKRLLPNRYLEDELICKDPGESSAMDADLVDWPPAERDGFVFSRVNTVVNALASAAYEAMSVMAVESGTPNATEDAREFMQKARNIRKSLNARLWDDGLKAYVDGLDELGHRVPHASLHANAFMLAFGDVPENRINALQSLIQSKGMACGPYVAAVLLEGLYRNGLGGMANALIGDDNPAKTHSWTHMIRTGAGATMESWDVGVKGNTTYSHPWSASPVYLLQRGMLGVIPLKPGFEEFAICPQLGKELHAEGTVPTPHGLIKVHCSALDGQVLMDVSIPNGTTARVADSQGSCLTLYAGEHHGIKVLRQPSFKRPLRPEVFDRQ